MANSQGGHSERSEESEYLNEFKDSSFHFVPFRMTIGRRIINEVSPVSENHGGPW